MNERSENRWKEGIEGNLLAVLKNIRTIKHSNESESLKVRNTLAVRKVRNKALSVRLLRTDNDVTNTLKTKIHLLILNIPSLTRRKRIGSDNKAIPLLSTHSVDKMQTL
jgi:hypothetical protein